MAETDPAENLGDPGSSNHYGLHLDQYSDYGEAYVEGPPPTPEIYGIASGIVGLRLFPRETDPDPRIRKQWERNRHQWDPVRYITDEEYYKDPDLIRPYPRRHVLRVLSHQCEPDESAHRDGLREVGKPVLEHR